MRTRFFRCQLLLMMFCGFLPAPVLFCCYSGSASLLPWLAVPTAFLVFSVICMLLPGKLRLAAAIPAGLAMLIGGCMLLNGEHIAVRVGTPLLFLALLIYSLPMAGWERGREPPLFIPAMGITCHLLTQFMLFVKAPEEGTIVAAVTPILLMVSFLIFLLLFMLSMNRQSMSSAMPDSHSVPVSIRRRNRILTLVMLVVVLLLSLIPAFGKLVRQAMEWLKALVLLIVKWLVELFAQQEGSSAGGGGGDMLAGLGDGETSSVALILEKILVVFAVILIVAALAFVLRFLWRKLGQLLRYLYAQLRHYAVSAAEDYEDEVVDTREQGGEHETLPQKLLRRRNAKRNLKDLPPREQVRTRYGLLRGKHPEWAPSGTARETLSESPASIYERARYSSHEITPEDSEAFASQQGR
ncbi:MAG: hypothetical protein IKK75_06940 [Clostridia bacterium]|nr:hypothetical protein [Clostridia bacterium]